MPLLDLLLKPSGKVSRLQFVGAGIALAAIKLTLDYLLTTVAFRGTWQPLDYLWSQSPFVALSRGRALEQYCTMLLVAAPFAWIGVCLCCKRLRDAGAPVWLAVFFFVPIAKWFLFAILSVLPPRQIEPIPRAGIPGASWWEWSSATRLRSAVVACAITCAIGLGFLWVSVYALKTYGSTLFLAMPFVLGLITAVIYGGAERRGLNETIATSLLAMLLVATALLALATEGAICIAMAAPIASGLNILGCMVGHAFIEGRRRRARHISLPALALLPLLLMAEQQRPAASSDRSVTTTVLINADRATVWRHVIAFTEIPRPREVIFRAGIAYPLRAQIEGTGVGATRHCIFSTGAFVEPITTWDAPALLAFDVSAQPDPLMEMSPYGRIDAPHLHGYFRSQRGEFRLMQMPDGRTLLAGTTWYVNRIEPDSYWRLWSDYLIHAIHRRVLNHIKAEAER